VGWCVDLEMIKHVISLLLLIGLSYSQGGSDALDFDGTDDYVEVSGYTGVTGTSSRTVELWIKTSGTGVLTMWGTNSPTQKFGIRVNYTSAHGTVGAIKAEVNSGYNTGSTDVRDGNWHHVAVTLSDDGSPNINESVIYIDGELESISQSAEKQVNTASSANVAIGYDSFGNTEYFDGQIDEVRIWSDARTAAEIKEYMHKEVASDASGLVAYYKMSNGSRLKTPFGHISKKFKQALRNIGADEKKNFHSLRHTFAVRSLIKGVSIYELKLLMGHSSVTTTECYSNINLKRVSQDFPTLASKEQEAVKLVKRDTVLRDTRMVTDPYLA